MKELIDDLFGGTPEETFIDLDTYTAQRIDTELADYDGNTADFLREIDCDYHEALTWFEDSLDARLDPHGPDRFGALIPVDELPDCLWRTRAGEYLLFSAMDDSHLVNTYLMLTRIGPMAWFLEKSKLYYDAPDDVLHEFYAMDWDRTTQYRETEYRAARRHIARRRLWPMVVSRITARRETSKPTGNDF